MQNDNDHLFTKAISLQTTSFLKILSTHYQCNNSPVKFSFCLVLFCEKTFAMVFIYFINSIFKEQNTS